MYDELLKATLLGSLKNCTLSILAPTGGTTLSPFNSTETGDIIISIDDVLKESKPNIFTGKTKSPLLNPN